MTNENKKIYTISKDSISEITVKKSKFICNIKKVFSESDAKEFIQKIKNKYSNATHNVPAYRVFENGTIKFYYSDDREPAKSAGYPIFNIIEKKNLVNIAVVVTRYFGGIKLGIGGLIKAYSESLLKALENNSIIEYKETQIIKIIIKYHDINFVKYSVRQVGGTILEEKYLDKVHFKIEIEKKKVSPFLNFLKSKINLET